VEGAMRVAFEREPSFFAAAKIQGNVHQTGFVRDSSTGQIIGMGTRSIAEAFINGEAAPLGYLSDLRLDSRYRNRTLVARGYRMLRELHQDGRAQLYNTVIFSDNKTALRTIAQGRAGLPTYHDCGLLHCPGINIGRRKPQIPFDGEIIRGSTGLLPEIVECLNRNNQRKQFAPYHRVEDFLPHGRWRGFQPDNFHVATRGKRIIGVIGKWDQRRFKQTRVIGYQGHLRSLQPMLNALPRIFGTPRLPKPGSVLAYFYASFAAIDGDDLAIFRALLREIYNDALTGEFDYFLIGLHERDPLRAGLNDYSLTPFFGRLFCVCFENDEPELRRLDERCPYIEIATL